MTMTSGMDPNMIIYHFEQHLFSKLSNMMFYLGQEHRSPYALFGVVEDGF